MTDRTDGANDSLRCEACGTLVEREEAIRRETIANLDPHAWQTLCCPVCGRRLRTVFVGGEDR